MISFSAASDFAASPLDSSKQSGATYVISLAILAHYALGKSGAPTVAQMNMSLLTVPTLLIALIVVDLTLPSPTNAQLTNVWPANCIFGTMKILQLNARSLNTSHQLIKDYVIAKGINIVAITETWGTNNIQPFQALGFSATFKDRSQGHHGGVLILHHSSLKTYARKDLEIPELEATWIETRIAGKQTFICCLYLPPGKQPHIKKLWPTLHSLGDNCNIYILGDLNCRNYLWESWHATTPPRSDIAFTSSKYVIDMCDCFNLTILNDGRYTRIQDDTISSPDLSLVRQADNVTWSVDHYFNIRSDHCPIIINSGPIDHKSVKKLDL
jgi:hypothetical protein